MIKLPINNKWSQLNSSDKFGSLAYTRNINLDEEGYIKLSPRSVNLFDDTETLTNSGDVDFDYPVAFGRYSDGSFRLATTDEPFNIDISETAKTISEDASSNNPNLNTQSHGVWWQNRFHESTDTAVSYNTAGTWTANAITGLTSGVRHYMTVFKNRNTLVVSNGNVLKQYDTSYANTTDLTIPSDFEITGIAYNNYRVAVITRLGTDSAGQNQDSYFFTWDGGSTEANTGVSIGALRGVTVFPYKSSFVVISSSGQLLYWNGGGFDELARLPFYLDEKIWGDLLNHLSYGDTITVDGDIILLNIGMKLSQVGKKGERPLKQCPSGVWCYDPEVGLYHRYSPSISRAYLHTIADSSINTSTDTFTTSVTIPDTGNPVMMTQGTVDLTANKIYYVIKLTSTTFKLATTKDNADVGIAIDITTATTSYFWMYDIKDYGISYYENAGAIGIWGKSTPIYRDMLFGSSLFDTSLTAHKYLNTNVPILESRGYFVTPKIYLDSVSETIPTIFIKHRVLDTNDKIIVKIKTKDYVGIPVSSPNNASVDEIIWTSNNEGYTTSDLSEAKTAFDAGEELELELIAGVGSGQMVKITDIGYGSGTYSFVVEENIVGASAGLKSHFLIENWKLCAYVDATTQSEGIFEVPIGANGRSPQLKVELRGYETTIEDFLIINSTHESA